MFSDEKLEEWKPVVGHEGFYSVSNLGRLIAHQRTGEYKGRWKRCIMNFPAHEKVLSTSTGGYHYTSLRLPDRPAVKYLVHRIVLSAFRGLPKPKQQANHLDGNKKNNRLENLEWCTPLENLRHCIDVLGKKRGESGVSKLKEADIQCIRDDPRTLKAIAADYGVTLQAIWMVKKRKNWSHIKE